jgi:hypothetical protein
MEPPYLHGGLGILRGYFKAMFTGHARYGDLDYLRYLRRFEARSLLLGKRRALRYENERIRGAAAGRAAPAAPAQRSTP